MGKFIVYRASAGSGKTFTLVKEYLKMAMASSDPQRFRKILAITFTNKAAAEMKERVISTLHQMAKGERTGAANQMAQILMAELHLDESTLQKRAANLLAHILHQYNDFSVGTIDSFMHRVVRTFAQDLRMPLNFSVELSNEVIIQMAIDELLELVGQNEAITDVLVGYTLSQTDDEKKNNIEEELSATAKDLLTEQYAKAISALKNLNMSDFLRLRSDFNAYCRRIEEELRRIGNQALLTLADANLDPSELYKGRNGIGNWFVKLSKAGESGLPYASNTVQTTLNENTWYSKASSNSPLARIIDSVSPQLSKLGHEALQILELNREEYILKKVLRDSLFRLALLNEISRIIDRIRNDESIVHISEFNKRVSKIVMEEPIPFIYERLGERYQHFMIDEFQDTSLMQWQNLLPLIHNGLAQNAGSLIVGDGKQAIYRFRGGEVGLFNNLPQAYPPDNHPLTVERHALLQQVFEGHSLDFNYRSARAIIEFNNTLYPFVSERFLPQRFIGVYNKPEQKAGKSAGKGFVQIELIPQGFNSAERDEEHAKRTLRIIRELVQNKNFQYRDIAILVRSNRNCTFLAKVLIESGIPVVSGESLLVDSSPDVLLILACLNILVNQDTHLNLFHVCTWLVTNKRLPFGTLEELLKRMDTPDESNLRDLLKEHGFGIDSVNQASASLFEVCTALIRMFGLRIQDHPYLLFFLEAVWQHSGRSLTDYTLFLNWWSENRKNQYIKIPESSNAVRILTIHKSKGLQFPVVIFPYAHGERKNRQFEWVINEGNLPGELPAARIPLTRELQETSFADLIQLEDEKAALDRINLMYVATTRPETALYIISGRSGNKGSLQSGWEEYLENFLLDQSPDEFEKGVVYWGDPDFRNENPASGSGHTFALIPDYSSGNWQSHIILSRESKKAWQADNADVQWGNLIHKAMELIHSPRDISGAIEYLLQAGFMTSQVQAELENKIHNLLSQPELRGLFVEGLNAKNERSLLLPDGSLLRPDRVILQENLWTVLDYKTGKPEAKHKEQIRLYMQQLIELKAIRVRGLLVYLHEPVRIEEVLPDAD